MSLIEALSACTSPLMTARVFDPLSRVYYRADEVAAKQKAAADTPAACNRMLSARVDGCLDVLESKCTRYSAQQNLISLCSPRCSIRCADQRVEQAAECQLAPRPNDSSGSR